jgi:1-acyl-sn-glycerol-3-phosphate acyltransferase
MLNLSWRVGVAAGCFGAFSVGGVALSLTVFPLLHVLPGGKSARERRARSVVRRSFAALLWVLQRVGMLELEAQNLAGLQRAGAVLVVANHPSYLDIVVLITHIPDAVCVVKAKLWSSPFFGGVVRAAGYIRNDEPEKLLRECAAKLAEGLPLIIFPEGTRTAPGTALHFVRGAAHIALNTGAPILPVVLRCEPRVLARGGKWYQMPARRFRIGVDVRPRTSAAALVAEHRPGPRSLTQALERFFIDHLSCHERTAA